MNSIQVNCNLAKEHYKHVKYQKESAPEGLPKELMPIGLLNIW